MLYSNSTVQYYSSASFVYLVLCIDNNALVCIITSYCRNSSLHLYVSSVINDLVIGASS